MKFGLLGGSAIETFFSQPEPRCWFKGRYFCDLLSAHSPPLPHLQQTKPVVKPAGSHGFPLGSPDVLCVHVGPSAMLAGLVPFL